VIVGGGIYDLVGEPDEIAILLPCFTKDDPSYIAFPWEKLHPPAKPIPIGWRNLNAVAVHEALSWRGGSIIKTGADFARLGVHEHEHEPSRVPGHVHVTDEHGNEGHGILRQLGDARWWIAGVFWTDGRIYIDKRCPPVQAREVMAAELAHSVDYFLPLSDFQKAQLMELWHGGGSDSHSWWEMHDYGSEYYDLGGEAFMAAFTLAYSSMEPDQSAFTHKTKRENAALVRTIVGFDLPGSTATICYRVGTSRKYHREGCWVVRFNRTLGRTITKIDISSAVTAGMTGCRFCVR
jgi:hypothetical protein